MSSTFYPPPNGVKSFWRTDPGHLDNFRSTPELPEEADIVVIGAGYAGAAIVTHIFGGVESRSKPSILVLEARELCSGATGRNGSHLKPEYWKGMRCLLTRGVEATKSTFSISGDGAEATNTAVRSVSPVRDDAGNWVLETSRGKSRARQIIFATNAYTGALLPDYSHRIIPYRGISSRIKTPGKRPFLNNTYSIRFSDKDFDYPIPRLDGSIIVGGARRAYILDKDEWYGNVDDTRMVDHARSYFDGYMQRHFAGWEDSGAYVDTWAGIMGFSSD
ncbi:hypothetical protein ACJZ2D_000917 [Fusarium nematophilum]